VATLHLMVGLPFQETTPAQKLEHELPALRLTPDGGIASLSNVKNQNRAAKPHRGSTLEYS
jgi:predicted kinase